LTCSNINAHINNQTPLVGESVALPVAHALRGEGFDASEDGTGRGTPIVPVARATGDRTHALTTRSAAEEDGTGRGTPIVPVAQSALSNDPAHAICANEQRTYTNEGNVFQLRNVVAQPAAFAMQVRRLTPTECERLQGFPDGYTNIPWRKKDEAPDGPRYKALGNSMAVPCMRWIGERIQAATARQEVQP
jgi:DNA (cytosine-5)-methyltransferase 1